MFNAAKHLSIGRGTIERFIDFARDDKVTVCARHWILVHLKSDW
jgi:hypothetical protein